jgi:hypothetical protein
VGTEPPVFRRIAPRTLAELQTLVERSAERIGRALERECRAPDHGPFERQVMRYSPSTKHAGM